jgi:tetratricopeptide (TPR) repeat protein
MKRTILTVLFLTLISSGLAQAQNPGDEAYIKAMQANSPAEKVKLLKEFLAQYGGQGNQYENYACANLCVIQFQTGQLNQETISYGEKAIAGGGIDDLMKSQVLWAVAATNLHLNQADKAKAAAAQVIQVATTAKGKESEAANAAAYNQLIGGSYFITAQALVKTKDIKGALEAYLRSYNILKDPKILAEVKKMGQTMYKADDFAGAEQVYRFLAQTGKDPEAANFIAQILYKQGKTAEAVALFKENYNKKKTGEMAYNIGILLAKEAETNPALKSEALNYLLDAAILGTTDGKRAQQARDIAQNLFMSQDKEWNDRVKAIQESQKLIDEWVKEINSKFGDKSEDELSSDQKREYKILMGNIDKEKKIIEGYQAQQKATMDKWDKLVFEARKRLGR